MFFNVSSRLGFNYKFYNTTLIQHYTVEPFYNGSLYNGGEIWTNGTKMYGNESETSVTKRLDCIWGMFSWNFNYFSKKCYQSAIIESRKITHEKHANGELSWDCDEAYNTLFTDTRQDEQKCHIWKQERSETHYDLNKINLICRIYENGIKSANLTQSYLH